MQPVELLAKTGIQFVHEGHQNILKQTLYSSPLIPADLPNASRNLLKRLFETVRYGLPDFGGHVIAGLEQGAREGALDQLRE